MEHSMDMQNVENNLLHHFKLPQKWSDFAEKDEEEYMRYVHPFLLFKSKLLDKVPDEVMEKFIYHSMQ